MKRKRSLLARWWRMQKVCAVAGCGAAVGAGVEYLMDPDRGHSRRARARDMALRRARVTLRRGSRSAARAAHRQIDHVEGELRSRVVRSGRREETVDDITLAQKVRSEALGHLERPLRHVLLDVADGVVTLRGEVASPEDKTKIDRAVRAVAGVRTVEDLLHLAGEDAPNKAAALHVDRATAATARSS
ncbi:MAG TPA: BON domain-containing protein [Acidimicrobiales bacterium]|nr:BON domain-containing protein [Acidimicrobiales bacterium]